jgi:hypothetical protein
MDTRAERVGIAPAAIQTERDILSHCHRLKEREVLQDHADAELPRKSRRSDHDAPSLPEDMPRVGLQQPIEHLHQGRLPGAVLTQQGVNLTCAHSEINPIIRHQSPEPLDQAARLEQRLLPIG